MNEEISKLLLSILSGIIAGLVILPISSDAIRHRLFSRQKRVIRDAKKELLEAIQGMLLSGQTINQHTFEKIAENISRKYEIPISTLGDKDNNIAQVLQAINSSKVLPNKLKKLYSRQLQEQLGDGSNSYGVSTDVFDIDNEWATEVICKWHENDNGQGDNINLSILENLLIVCIAVVVGSFVTLISYTQKSYTIFPILLCIAAFLVCINMLTSLVGTSESKDIDFFRRLIYKIIFIIVLIIFIIVLIIFLR